MLDNTQYLISFVATVQGGKIAISQLQQMEQTTGKLDKGMVKAGKSANNFSRMLKRSAMVIPLWFVLRRVFMGIMNTITNMVKSWLELDDALARIKTVVSASSKSIEADMIAIRRTILDTAVTTRVSIKELSETFYFLRTAGLSTQEAIGAFKPTVDAMVGTMNSGKDTARLMAGVFNTMGKYIGDNLTVTEKFTRIADVLTYTYATQDVQLQELTQSYMKLAPYTAGMSDSFLEMITMLGFLNTRLLRSGRTGRLTGRAFIQITKNADKLAGIFDVTFESDKPLGFLDIIGQIHDRIGTTGKISAKASKALEQVFMTRGAVAVRLLIENFEELKEEIGLAGESSKDFAKRMREIREATVTAQFEKMRNILHTMFAEFMSGFMATGDLTEALKEFNDGLTSSIQSIKTFGSWVGWLQTQMSQLILGIMALQNIRQRVALGEIGFGEGIAEYAKWLRESKIELISFAEWQQRIKEEQEKMKEIREEEVKVQEKLVKQEKDLLTDMEIISSGLSTELNIMKALENTQLSILKMKKMQLELDLAGLDSDKKEIELEKVQGKITVETIKQHKKLADTYLKAELDILKTMGVHQLDILEYELKILEGSKNLVDSRKRQEKMGKVRTKLAKIEKQWGDKLGKGLWESVDAHYKMTKEQLYELELAEALSGVEGEKLRIEELKLLTTKERVNLLGYYSQVYATQELNMAKALGASEFQILQIEREQLEARRDQLLPLAYQAKLLKIINKEEILRAKTLLNQLSTYGDIMKEFEKATPLERPMLLKRIQMQRMSPEELYGEIKGSAYIEKIWHDNMDKFSEMQNLMAKKASAEANRLDIWKVAFPDPKQTEYDIKRHGQTMITEAELFLSNFAELYAKAKGKTDVREQLVDLFAPSKATAFWATWTDRALEAVQAFKTAYQNAIEITPKGKGAEAEGVGLKSQIIKNLELFIKGKPVAQMTIEAMTIQLPPDTLERVSFETASIVERRLKENEDLQKFLADVIRPHL